MTALYLIRHGETANNKTACFNGCRSDQPLNERGAAQATCLAEAMAQIEFDAIYTSPLRRAVMTAEILRGQRAIPLTRVEEMKEMDMGELDGVSFMEANRRYPGILAAWVQTPETLQMPGGENFAQVMNRATAAVFQILRENRGKTVAVVAHGALLRLVMASFLGLPIARKEEISNLVNTGYYALSVADDGYVTVLADNQYTHLQKELAPGYPPLPTPPIKGQTFFVADLKK